MTFHRPWVCLGARLAAIAVTALLCACAGERDLPAEPSFYASLATKDAQVDAAMAASMISGYRTNNGLTAVTLDPELMKLAEVQAQAMASRDTLSHDVARSFHDRLKGGGYRACATAHAAGSVVNSNSARPKVARASLSSGSTAAAKVSCSAAPSSTISQPCASMALRASSSSCTCR